MRRTSRFSRAACLGFFVAALFAQGACEGPVLIESARQCSDDSFSIDLTEMEDANLGHDAEERVEQLRDWIWPLLLARLEATTELEGLLIGSATQPLIRDDALAHVVDLPVGSTRSGIAADGTVVVMVEDADDAAMQQVMLEAIDQEAMHLGKTPPQVVVYRYAIDGREGFAHLCPFGTFDDGWIESQGHGFRRATVQTARDLESFLNGGVDLLTAQCTEQGLEVTGRSRPRVRNAPITAEHVAALDPPAITSYMPPTDLVGFPTLSPEERQWVYTTARALYDMHPQELVEAKQHIDPPTWDMLVQVYAWRREYPAVPVEHLMLSWMMQKDRQSAGFSLDPKLFSNDAAGDLNVLLGALADPAHLAALLHSWNAAPDKAALLVLAMEEIDDLPELVRERLSTLQRELAGSSDQGALAILSKFLYHRDDPEELFAAVAAWILMEHSAYQCARYDGPLQGTLTGMTMFYTDLLMKLWSADQFDLAPEGLIPGFESVVGHELSSTYCTAEEDQPHWTRAWLGLREEPYVLGKAERVRFAPVVTRLFARGSQHGPDYPSYSEEVEASAAMHRFYRWWNAHYARIAAWEPQYELLNQLMKWSVVTQMAALSEHEDCLGFLDQVPVDRSHQFDQWVDKHEELRWRGPVPLVQRDGERTECLPLLRLRSYSSCGGEGHLTGGISMPRRATVAGAPMGKLSRARQVTRLSAKPSKTPSLSYKGRGGYNSTVRAGGTQGNVEIDPAARVFRARVDATQSQRGTRHRYATNQDGAQGAVTGLKNERSLHQRRLSARDALEVGDSTWGVAHLHEGEVTSAMLRPKVTPDPAAQMRAIGDEAVARLADGKKSLSEIASDLPGVTTAYRLSDDTVLLKLTHSAGSSPRYGIMSSRAGNRGPPGTLTAHFGSSGTKGANGTVEIALLSDGAARPMLGRATKIPSQRAELIQAAQALDAHDLASAEGAITAYMVRGGHNADVTKALAQVHRRAVRLGTDTHAIEALQLRTSIRYGKPRAPVRERNVLPADGTVFLAPRSHANIYADLASLPPGQNPALRPGEPQAAFSARALEESPTLSEVPSVVHVDGVDYVRLQRPEAMPHGARTATYIIEPCRRPGENESSVTVECHGRTTARHAEEALRQRLHRQACGDEKVAEAFGVTSCGQSPRP
jgi:hypothetical protein